MTIYDFYFVRHGSTNYNDKKIIQGQADKSSIEGIKDLPLNDKGIAQATSLIDVIKDSVIEFDMVVSSPLLRAYQTGEIVAKALNKKIIKNENFREMFFGAENEGVPVEEFKTFKFSPVLEFKTNSGEKYTIENGKQLREYHKNTDERYDNLGHPGGEIKLDVMKRAENGLLTFIKNNPNVHSILIPTHNALLRFFMSTIDRNSAGNKVGHTEIVHIVYNSEEDKFVIKRRIKNYLHEKN